MAGSGDSAGAGREMDAAHQLDRTEDNVQNTGGRESSPAETNIRSFFKTYFAANGAPQLLALSFLLSFGLGSTIGVVPNIASDRYARLHHNYDGIDCFSFDRAEKPDACQRGADDAQASAAMATLIQYLLTLFTNSTIGSMSDARGRRNIMLLSMFLWTLSPFVLFLMQIVTRMDPAWFYVSTSMIGLVNWVSIAFAMLSDVIPSQYRAPSYGLFLSFFYLGLSISPSLALVLSHFQLSALSFMLIASGFVFSVSALPETLPRGVALRVKDARNQEGQSYHYASMLRPIRDMSILNQDWFFRLLTLGAFFSGMVYSTDVSLVLYYIEDQLDVRDGDLARMFIIMGFVAVAIQGLLLQSLVQTFGEKGMLIISFASGTLHNLLYGLAKSKSAIYMALCLSQLTKTNFPIMSSLASKNANAHEQGRVQGALAALSALANGVGPITLELIYNRTKDGGGFGPGTMFVVASILYGIGTLVVSSIPTGKTRRGNHPEDAASLEEPLLGPELDAETHT